MVEISTMIRLCYIIQLTLRNGHYLGGPDIITRAGFSLACGRRTSERFEVGGFDPLFLTRRWKEPCGRECRQLPEPMSVPQLTASKEKGSSNLQLQVNGFSQ